MFFPSAAVIDAAFPCLTWAVCRSARGDPLFPSFSADKANPQFKWHLNHWTKSGMYFLNLSSLARSVPWTQTRPAARSFWALHSLTIGRTASFFPWFLFFFFVVVVVGFCCCCFLGGIVVCFCFVLLGSVVVCLWVFFVFSYSKVTLQVPTALLQLTKCTFYVVRKKHCTKNKLSSF